MRFANPNEYGDAVLFVAGCTCHPKRVLQELDATGAFLVEHYHADDCAKTVNGKLWHARLTGSVAPDNSTTRERYERRVNRHKLDTVARLTAGEAPQSERVS